MNGWQLGEAYYQSPLTASGIVNPLNTIALGAFSGGDMGRGSLGGYTPGSNFSSNASAITDIMKYTQSSNTTTSNSYNAAKLK